jgi:hypothetical protein
MASYYLSPFATFLQLFSETGVPLSGGLVWTYLAGTTTPSVTYTDQTGVVANSNPIQMGSDGRLQNVSIWQAGAVPLKFVFSTNAGTTVSPVFGTQLGPTFDQISGINDPALLTGLVTGNFLATFGGFSGTAPTATVYYNVIDNVVTVVTQTMFVGGPSNAPTFTLSGVPAAIQPPSQTQYLPIWWADNSGSAAISPFIGVTAGSGTWNIGQNVSFNSWLSSGGTKGIEGFTFSYLLL